MLDEKPKDSEKNEDSIKTNCHDNIYNLNKIKISKLRSNANSVLATIFCTAFLAIGITLFSSHSNKEKYQFPEQISLAGWELQATQSLDQPLEKGAIAAQQYSYNSSQQNDLRIAMIYVGGIIALPKDFYLIQLPTNLQTQMRYQPTTGHYVVFDYASRSYLAACINPRGQSTITEDQFMNNRNSNDITGDRLLLYIVGLSDLRDTRCLLAVLSIPSSFSRNNSSRNFPSNSLEADYQKLEVVWQQWHQLWQANFPI